jgi:hypothetical protein
MTRRFVSVSLAIAATIVALAASPASALAGMIHEL